MSKSREPDPVTLSQLVRRACQVVDPSGTDAAVGEFEMRFEDADMPVVGIQSPEEILAFGADEYPAVEVAKAVVLHLMHRRQDLDAPDEHLIQKAIKDEYHEHPPPEIANWLAEQGVGV